MNRLFRAKDILQTLRQPPEDLQFHEIVVPASELEKEQEKEILVDESTEDLSENAISTIRTVCEFVSINPVEKTKSTYKIDPPIIYLRQSRFCKDTPPRVE